MPICSRWFIHSLITGDFSETFHTRLNWLTMEMSGLYGVGAVFPRLSKIPQNGEATLRLHWLRQTRNQFLPDGAQMELSSTYQNVALDNILHIAEIARWTRVRQEN